MSLKNLVQNNIELILKDKSISAPKVWKIEAGVLFIDVSSYTKKTETASAKGHYGIETITGMLNGYFDMIDGIVSSNGGYLIKYGGDAILAVFPHEKEIAIPAMLQVRVMLPIGLKELNKQFQSDFKEEFHFHGGCSWGECELNIVGDKKYHLDYYLSGKCVLEAYQLADNCGEDDISCPNKFNEFAAEKVEISQCSSMNRGKEFLPTEIEKKLDSGSFTAELRQTVVIFLKLQAKDSDIIPIDLFHQVYSIIQDIVYRLKGIVDKIDFNDKGYIALITFGTITINPDDIERAFICAYRIKQHISGLIDLKIGLTKDSIYSGIIGSKEHYEFGIIGNSVNVAARLLSAVDTGGIAFTEAIQNRISDKFETEFVQETSVKGIKKPIKIFSLIRECSEVKRLYETSFSELKPVAHGEVVSNASASVLQQDGSCYYYSGDSGTGKSFIAYSILKTTEIEDDQVCLLVADEYNKENHLELIRKLLQRELSTDDIVRDILLVSDFCKEEMIICDIHQIQEYLSSNLKGDFLFEGELSNRRKQIEQTLSTICSRLLSSIKLMIIDNYQWVDSGSKDILTNLIKITSSSGVVSIVISGESSNKPLPYAQTFEFHDLNEKRSSEFVSTILRNATAEAHSIIFSMTSGNPLLIMEICKLLRREIKGEYDLISGQKVKQFLIDGNVSDNMASIFMNEFDNLQPEQQQMLRFASIIGKAFSLDELQEITNRDKADPILSTIEDLQQDGVITKIDLNPTLLFIFNNKLMRETIYSSVLKSEKISLHEKLGHYYESNLSEMSVKNYELVATHYILAENKSKALKYSLLAGEKNLRISNIGVALHYYKTALSFAIDDKDLQKLTLIVTDIYLQMSETDIAEKMLLGLNKETLEEYALNSKYNYLQARLLLLKSDYSQLTEIKIALDIDDLYSVKTALYQLDAYRFTGDFEKFDLLSEKFKQLFGKAEREDYLGELLAIIGQNMIYRGEYAKAEECYARKLSISLKREDFYSSRVAYSSLGIISSRQGNKSKAKEFYLLALEAADKSGDRNGYSKVMMDLGTLSKNEDKFEEAEEYYRKSLATAKTIGNQQQESVVLYNIGEMLMWQEEFEKALTLIRECRLIAVKLSDVVSLSYCDDAIGDCYFRLEKVELSEQTYKENEKRQIKINDREGLAHTWGNLGNIAKVKENYDEAIHYYDKQRELLQEVGDLDGEGRAYFNWAMIHVIREENDAAIDKLKKAHSLFTKCGAVQLVEFTQEQINKYSQ
jgi:class 3 adenylate cyclase/predicted ATPase